MLTCVNSFADCQLASSVRIWLVVVATSFSWCFWLAPQIFKVEEAPPLVRGVERRLLYKMLESWKAPLFFFFCFFLSLFFLLLIINIYSFYHYLFYLLFIYSAFPFRYEVLSIIELFCFTYIFIAYFTCWSVVWWLLEALAYSTFTQSKSIAFFLEDKPKKKKSNMILQICWFDWHWTKDCHANNRPPKSHGSHVSLLEISTFSRTSASKQIFPWSGFSKLGRSATVNIQW